MKANGLIVRAVLTARFHLFWIACIESYSLYYAMRESRTADKLAWRRLARMQIQPMSRMKHAKLAFMGIDNLEDLET